MRLAQIILTALFITGCNVGKQLDKPAELVSEAMIEAAAETARGIAMTTNYFGVLVEDYYSGDPVRSARAERTLKGVFGENFAADFDAPGFSVGLQFDGIEPGNSIYADVRFMTASQINNQLPSAVVGREQYSPEVLSSTNKVAPEGYEPHALRAKERSLRVSSLIRYASYLSSYDNNRDPVVSAFPDHCTVDHDQMVINHMYRRETNAHKYTNFWMLDGLSTDQCRSEKFCSGPGHIRWLERSCMLDLVEQEITTVLDEEYEDFTSDRHAMTLGSSNFITKEWSASQGSFLVVLISPKSYADNPDLKIKYYAHLTGHEDVPLQGSFRHTTETIKLNSMDMSFFTDDRFLFPTDRSEFDGEVVTLIQHVELPLNDGMVGQAAAFLKRYYPDTYAQYSLEK